MPETNKDKEDAPLKLLNGREVDIDLQRITMPEWRLLLNPETKEEEEYALLAKIVKWKTDDVGDLSYLDFRLLGSMVSDKANDPISELDELSDKREVDIDLRRITIREFRYFLRSEKEYEVECELLAKIVKWETEEVVNLSQPDFRLLGLKISTKASESISDPNSSST